MLVENHYGLIFLFNLLLQFTNLKKLSSRRVSIIDAVNLLLQTIRSTESDAKLDELRNKINDTEKFVRLLNYVKDLTPSDKSGVDTISFEDNRTKKFNTVRLGRDTRKVIINYAQKVLPDKQYITGSALIRAQDIDSGKIFARPLTTSECTYDNLECIISKDESINNYLNKIVEVSGDLVAKKDGSQQKLEVDAIKIRDED